MGSYEQTMLKLEKMAQANTATQMNWQKNMSDTSHQREVKDLIAAGLNPVLSSGGSGAQSYTTSVDSAVNGIAGMASAREGANATRYAAQQSAAATRAAAAAQVQAAYIAAEASKWNTAHSKSGTIAGIASNFAQDVLSLVKQKGLTNSSGNFFKQTSKQMINNPNKFLKDSDQSWTWKNINANGRANIKYQLKDLGLNNYSDTVRDWFIKGVYGGDINAQRRFGDYLAQYLSKRNTSANRLNR